MINVLDRRFSETHQTNFCDPHFELWKYVI